MDERHWWIATRVNERLFDTIKSNVSELESAFLEFNNLNCINSFFDEDGPLYLYFAKCINSSLKTMHVSSEIKDLNDKLIFPNEKLIILLVVKKRNTSISITNFENELFCIDLKNYILQIITIIFTHGFIPLLLTKYNSSQNPDKISVIYTVEHNLAECSKLYRSNIFEYENMKYILVTGGVISGIGKGIISSSVGTLLKSCGFRVTAIKIDPYLNIDAGTFSPYEHGEVYVLDDGGEVDLDLGNYERFLDVTLTRENNITTGKIYEEVIKKERKGDYLGKTVQVVPHITNEIQDWITKVARIPIDQTQKEPEICIIEMGGTIGDIESAPFIEAFRQFQFRVGINNFCSIHVSLIPCPKSTHEQKSKPTQASVRELRGLGISPDILMCRSENSISSDLKDKLSMFCHVQTNQVISVEDVPTLYQVPLLLYSQKVHEIILRKLHLNAISAPKKDLYKWKRLCDQDKKSLREVNIVLVGKYVNLEDAYISVYKALNHAALFCNSKLIMHQVNAEHLIESNDKNIEYLEAWKKVSVAMGVIVPGGFGPRGIEGKIAAIKFCRENKVPILGVCLGMQCQVIEFARNVLGMHDAHSEEFDPDTKHKVVIEMPEFNPSQKGGTMRLGKRETFFHTKNQSINGVEIGSNHSVIHYLYNNVKSIEERHRHRYEVNTDFLESFEKKGMIFVGRDKAEERMEILELNDHPYFVGVQYHPEYLSRPNRPSPPYFGLILAATKQLCKKLKINGHRNRNDSFLTDEEDDVSLITYKPVNDVILQNGD